MIPNKEWCPLSHFCVTENIFDKFDGYASWNSSWKKRNDLLSLVKPMVVGGLVKQWAKALVGISLSYSFRNILVSGGLHHRREISFIWDRITPFKELTKSQETGKFKTSAWINNCNNYIHYKVWDEITYPFSNVNVQPMKLGNGWMISSNTWVCNYYIML